MADTPLDPNEVVGTPTEREIWLAPDWSKRGNTQQAAGPGSTKVTVRTVTYRNGRQVTYVLDENHEPVKNENGYAPGLTETVDPDVKRAWDQTQAQAARGDQEGDIRGPQTNPTREVYRGGKWVFEPNPGYQAPATAQAAPPTEKDENGRHYIWQPNPGGPDKGGQWIDTGPSAPDKMPKPPTPPTERVNPADPTRRQVWNPTANGGAGGWDDAGAVAQDASKPPTERVNPSDPTRRQIWNPRANNGAGAWEDGGTVAQDASKPPTERVNPADPSRRQIWNPKANGGAGGWEDSGAVAATSPYTDVKFDPDTKKWWGLTKAGKWEEMPGGGPGTQPANQTAGPPMPEIIVGHSQEALRDYGAKLDALVAAKDMTPAERVRRFNEALAVAQHTVNEATLVQREQESNLNASVNLANSRLSASTTGFGQALSFVNNINGWLPKNSTLGGQAFEALLGLQLMQAQKMGAYDNIVPGSQPSVAGRRGESPTAAIAADTQATLNERAQEAPAAMTPAAASDAAAAPVAADQQQQQASAGAATGPSTGPTGQVPRPGGPDIPGATPPPTSALLAINPATGEPTGLAPLPGQPGAPPAAVPPTPAWQPYQPGTPPVVVRTFPGHDPQGNPATVTEYNDGHSEYTPLAQAQGQDDFAVLRGAPAGVALRAPTPMPTLAQTQLPPPQTGGDFAVLNQPMAASAPSPASEQGTPYALTHAMAASKPPWQMTPDELQAYLAAGVPSDVVFGVPRRSAAA
jgi:hypothetical protein